MRRSMVRPGRIRLPLTAWPIEDCVLQSRAHSSAIAYMTTTEIETPIKRAPIPSGANSAGILRYLTIVGLIFLALMVSLEPDVGFSAPPVARLLFWTLQVAIGLFVLQSVLYVVTRRYGASRIPTWSLVLLSGVLGAFLLAPAYWLIGEGLMEGWFGYPARPDEEGVDFIDVTFSNPLLREYVDIVGPVTTAWTLICLPRLHWLVPPLLHPQTQANVATPQPLPRPADDNPSLAASAPRPEAPPAGDSDTAPERRFTGALQSHDQGIDIVVASSAPTRTTWSERLPPELGTDVIAVSSELQYLRVWTSRGCALILGALADVDSAEAAHGMRVHRSWWVALEHVVSVRRTAAGTVCLMSDGRQVPVSRRRSAEVLARFGDGAHYRVAGASKAVADTDLY